ncbi:MAG: class F sortase [Caldilineaceae bacterium]|nr:class F sortase [Caldilineaceae bacterium]
MKHSLSMRNLLIVLVALATLLVGPMAIGVESQSTVTTATATATRRTFSWPTVTPTPAATARATATARANARATAKSTAIATRPVTTSQAAAITTTVTATVSAALQANTSPEITGTVAISQAVPVRLRIPAIGVDATIEPVGQDRNGRMDTPSLVEDVAWYAPGLAPGEIGNAVLAGHLDRIGGAPAVFWKLGKLMAGDDIFVTDSAGGEHHFRVTAQEAYPYEDAPLDEIFGFGIRSRLNLITCRGRWDRSGQTYTQRLVVFSELVESTRP